DRTVHGLAAAVLYHHRHICTVEVRRDVRAHRAQRRQRFEPYVADDAAVVPPGGQSPVHDVVASPPRRVVDTHDYVVVAAGDKRLRRIKGEGSVAALVVAEEGAV